MMGGHTETICGNSLFELFDKLLIVGKYNEEHKVFVYRGMECIMLTAITIAYKNDDGKWTSFGRNGIESAIGMTYNEEPKEKWVMFTYWE